MPEVHGGSYGLPKDETRLQAQAQALVDAYLLAAHRAIPIQQAHQMDEVDIGGSALSAALQALMLTTQASALPNTEALAFTVGVAFASILNPEDWSEMFEILAAMGSGVSAGRDAVAIMGATPQGQA